MLVLVRLFLPCRQQAVFAWHWPGSLHSAFCAVNNKGSARLAGLESVTSAWSSHQLHLLWYLSHGWSLNQTLLHHLDGMHTWIRPPAGPTITTRQLMRQRGTTPLRPNFPLLP